MQPFCSLFSQILKVIPRSRFEQLTRKHGSERHARGFTSWQQLVAMLFCHIGRAQSLREIEHGLRSAQGKLSHLGIEVPHRSTLSYANEHRPWQLFESLFYVVLEQCRSARPGRHALRFKNPLLSVDSTTVELVSEMFSWARYNKRKGAIKLHLVLDHDGLLPTYAVVTDLGSGDITVGRTIKFEAGSVVVFDRGYIDYEWLRSLDTRGVFFVTRLKKTAHFKVIEERTLPRSRSVIRDQVVDLTHVRRSTRGGFVPLRLRRVEIVDPETDKHLVFYSNLMDFGATTISRIYKQ